MSKIIVYTDGSAIDNGSPDSACGWAFKIISSKGEITRSGSDTGKSNNQMEMRAVLEAMRSITDKNKPVEIRTDSEYVVGTMNERYEVKRNRQLWNLLMAETREFDNITFKWVRGHGEDENNVAVDQMANEAAKQADRKHRS